MSAPTRRHVPTNANARTGATSGTVGLGRWFGIPVRAHWTTIVTAAIFVELLGAEVLPGGSSPHRWIRTWLVAVVTVTLFLVTVLLHEMSHALVARRRGMGVERVTLWTLGGSTELAEEPRTPRDEAVVALSGPLISIAIGIVCGGAALLVTDPLMRSATIWLAAVSVLIGLFNMLPGAPLDGGRVLRAALWARSGDRRAAVRGEARAGRRLGATLLTLGLLVFVLTWSPAGLWLFLIGLYIRNSATLQGRDSVLSDLESLVARDAMLPAPASVPSWWTLGQIIDALSVEQARAAAIPVVDLDGHVVDAVTMTELLDASRARRAKVRVGDLPRHVPALLVGPTEPLGDMLTRMRSGSTAVVVDRHDAVGVISTAAIMRLVQLSEIRHRVTPPGP